MKNIKFDTLKTELLDSLVELENICFTIPWSRKLFENDLNNKNAFYVLALDDNTVIGYCGLYKVLDEADITNIAVHPQFRNRGIAKSILNKIFKHCLDNKISKLTLEVRKSNYVAMNLYRINGFEVVGERKNYYSDNGETAVLMTKYIGEVE